jgi:excinuclease UvrABC nuclease subunit
VLPWGGEVHAAVQEEAPSWRDCNKSRRAPIGEVPPLLQAKAAAASCQLAAEEVQTLREQLGQLEEMAASAARAREEADAEAAAASARMAAAIADVRSGRLTAAAARRIVAQIEEASAPEASTSAPAAQQTPSASSGVYGDWLPQVHG